jgi:hypothetical protein
VAASEKAGEKIAGASRNAEPKSRLKRRLQPGLAAPRLSDGWALAGDDRPQNAMVCPTNARALPAKSLPAAAAGMIVLRQESTRVHSGNHAALEERVVRAAEAALERQQYVSAIDVLVGMGLLPASRVEDWRKGRIDFLERAIQGNLQKISFSMAAFRRWAEAKELRPSETSYVRRTRSGTVELRFSVSGDPSIEKHYRTHFVSPALSERKREKLEERLGRAPELVAFEILRDSECSECGAELPEGSFLAMEVGQPLCLPCARLGDLEFLPAGDTALTRRAGKYSERTTGVVRFSRSRGRYERQGILVEQAALEKAERECVEDAEERAGARARAAEARGEQDRALVARMMERLADLFPGCPRSEVRAIAERTAARGSGRVGRTAAGRNLEERALTAAVIAAIRHTHTNYDSLLASGLDRELARRQVADRVEEVLNAWRQ